MEGHSHEHYPNAEILKESLRKFLNKEVRITNEQGQVVVGTLHSAPFEFGSHLNIVNVQIDKSSKEILEKEKYYHPDINFEPKKGTHNFRFANSQFVEDPEKTDLLVMPIHGCIIECEGEFLKFN